MLLVDDVQFLERKTRTEEEFFHTFNALHDGGRQVVLTSDRPPRDLQALEDRLRERFAGRASSPTSARPTCTTRLAILRKRAQHDGIELADERALELIAEHVQSNVRALEGALIRVVAFSSLTGPAAHRRARRARFSATSTRAPSGRRPARHDRARSRHATCAHFGISAEELVSSAPRCPRRLAAPGRHVPRRAS